MQGRRGERKVNDLFERLYYDVGLDPKTEFALTPLQLLQRYRDRAQSPAKVEQKDSNNLARMALRADGPDFTELLKSKALNWIGEKVEY